MNDFPDSRPQNAATTALVSRDVARTAIAEACRSGDATLRAHIDELRSVVSDPEAMRSVLARYRGEVEAARALLERAVEPGWWTAVTVEELSAACTAARIWSTGDPVCTDLERHLHSHLLRVFGVDVASLVRG
ncbi:hypothetical protein GRS96_06085 [Rathayibacter sp. VKM Ac-2803]|uniref:hypothetical protein n=1 Tax=unclassified Rathayibacter TaxID=2609250 RepID=UPI00135A5EB8|nr:MULTISPECIES: hypothetical protein [unclassified Rathayibacter]MWV48846.1 hypothetical protein [Rathayibacter sp. VKM Ac-2803]MWV58653.1 hypothetical protein [Rathayibacter sp. VKM Ac-2754]